MPSNMKFSSKKEHRKTESQTGRRNHLQFAAVAGGRGGCIKWKVAEVEESDKQIKKVSEGEGDEADGGGKENKGIKVSWKKREKSSRGEKERRREGGRWKEDPCGRGDCNITLRGPLWDSRRREHAPRCMQEEEALPAQKTHTRRRRDERSGEKEKLPKRLRWEFCARTNTV